MTPRGVFAANPKDLLQYLKLNLSSPAVIFTLGAGDIYLLHDQIIAAISA